MKRYILIFISAILLNTLNVFSQRGPIIGVGGSVNSVWVLYPNAYGYSEYAHYKFSNYKSTMGGDMYLAFNQNFNDVFGIKVELKSSTQGQKFESTDNDTVSSKDIKSKYIQIPVMVRIASTGEHFKVHFLAGPQFGFLKSVAQSNVVFKGESNFPGNKYIIKNNDNKEFPLNETDITDRYKKMDLLLTAELGFDIFIIDKLFVNLGFRLHYGLTDINDKDWQFPDKNNVTYNHSRNIYGGVTFGINYILKY